MKRFVWLAVVSCLCLWTLTGVGWAASITYEFFEGGPQGSLIVEFSTEAFVDGTTNLNPFTLTVAPAGLSTTGRLQGAIGPPGFQPTFFFFGVDGSVMVAHINFPFGNSSNQFPTSAGVFALSGSAVFGPFVPPRPPDLIASLDTLVISTPSTSPELTALGPGRVWIGLKNSDAVGLRVDLKADVFAEAALIGSGVLPNVATGSSGFNNARLQAIPLALVDGAVELPAETELALTVSVRRTCFGSGHNSGTVRLWYNGQPVDSGSGRDAGSHFEATIDGEELAFFLRSAFELSEEPGTSRLSQDAAVNSQAACPDRPYTTLGTWSLTVP